MFTQGAQALGGLLKQGIGNIGQGIGKAFGFGGDGGGAGAGAGGSGLQAGMDFSTMSPDDIKGVQQNLGVTVDGIVGPETQGAYDTWSSGQPTQDTNQGADNAAKQAMNEAKKETPGNPLTDAMGNMDFGHYSSYK